MYLLARNDLPLSQIRIFRKLLIDFSDLRKRLQAASLNAALREIALNEANIIVKWKSQIPIP